MHRRRQHSVSDRTPNFTEPQIYAGGLSDVFRWRLDQNSRQAQSLAHTRLFLPFRILQGRQMAPIQLESITMLAKKLLVWHTRSISFPKLRGRDCSFYFVWKDLLFVIKIKILCTTPCGIPRLLPRVLLCEAPRRLSPADRTKIGSK